MLDYPWPGNIRELKHCLERACVLSREPQLSAELLFGEALPPRLGDDASGETLSDYLQTCEKRYIEAALRLSHRRDGRGVGHQPQEPVGEDAQARHRRTGTRRSLKGMRFDSPGAR